MKVNLCVQGFIGFKTLDEAQRYLGQLPTGYSITTVTEGRYSGPVLAYVVIEKKDFLEDKLSRDELKLAHLEGMVQRMSELVALAVAAERERCCKIVYGMAGSDNAAQRTVEKIRKEQA